MAFFSIPTCPACGKRILDDKESVRIRAKAPLCRECSGKVSMDAAMLPFQTEDDIKDHMAYRAENLAKYKEFSVSQVANIDKTTSLVLDDESRQWYVGAEKKRSLIEFKVENPPIYSYDDIIDYQLLEDGADITTTGLGSAVAGGLLFGGVGALVGSIAGTKKSQKEIDSLRIVITVNNPYAKAVTIDLLPAGTSCRVGDFSYKGHMKTATEILNMLEHIAPKTALPQASEPTVQQAEVKPVVSEAEQLMQFKALLDQGILTQEEFNAKKKQILGL